MPIRLKRNRVGARLILRSTDLLLAQILPPSVGVWITKVLVSRDGHVELAEWRIGVESTYMHREGELASDQLNALTEALMRLRHADRLIAFEQFDCDFGEYERPERTLLRFRVGGEERQTFLPRESFFEEHGVDLNAKADFEDAFRDVVALLPLTWLTNER